MIKTKVLERRRPYLVMKNIPILYTPIRKVKMAYQSTTTLNHEFFDPLENAGFLASVWLAVEPKLDPDCYLGSELCKKQI